MRKWTKELTCEKCGKVFTHEFNDAIMPKDRELMEHPVCLKCQIKQRMKVSDKRTDQS